MSETHTVPTGVSSLLSPTQRLVAFSKQVNGMNEIHVAALDDSMSRTLLANGRLSCRPVGWWKRQVFVACQHDSEPDVSEILDRDRKL